VNLHCLFVFSSVGVLEMNGKEHHAATYGFTSVPDGIENPLWVGNVSAEEGEMAMSASQHALRAETHSASPNNADFSAPQFPVTDCSQVRDGQLISAVAKGVEGATVRRGPQKLG